jgi:signal peptidase I
MTNIEAKVVAPTASKSEPVWAIALIFALGFALLSLLLASPMLIRVFLYQPFSTPTGSMLPTLLAGDYVFASKFAYGYGRYTWPFIPPAEGRIWGRQPERGDVVVFKLKDGTTDYIKRVVGVGGDRIQMQRGVLYLNGMPVPRERVDDFTGLDPCGMSANARVKRWRETLPNGVSYETLDCVDNGFFDTTNAVTVPPGHLFVLGDNRDNSTDSRVMSQVGFVPVENVVGRASLIYFSMPPVTGAIQYDRIGTRVR